MYFFENMHFIYGIYLAKIHMCNSVSLSHFQFMKLNSLLYSQDNKTTAATTTTVTHQPAVTSAPSGMTPTKTSYHSASQV